MILELTEQQTAFQQRIEQFAAERIRPEAAAIDESGEFPRAVVAELARLGLMGVTVPTKWGGAGLDYVSYALAIEAMAAASAVVAVIAAINNSLVAEPIAEFGTEAQKQNWLRRLASGESLGAFALSEEHAGSDAANQQSVARLDERGYVINGRKVWVANAAGADLLVLFAATQPGIRGRGVSAFLVPMDTPGIKRLRCPGFSRCARSRLHGPRACGTCASARTRCSGIPGDGFRIAMWALDGGRVAIAAQALGLGNAALEEALSHAKSREAFGQPIGNYQAIQWMLADMATELDAARMLTMKAADSRERERASDPRRVDGEAVCLGGRAPRRRQGDADSRVERLPPRLGGRAAVPRRSRDGDLPGHVRSSAHGDRGTHPRST